MYTGSAYIGFGGRSSAATSYTSGSTQSINFLAWSAVDSGFSLSAGSFRPEISAVTFAFGSTELALLYFFSSSAFCSFHAYSTHLLLRQRDRILELSIKASILKSLLIEVNVRIVYIIYIISSARLY